MGHLPVSSECDTTDVSKTPHLEALEAAEMANEDWPPFRAEEQGWKRGGTENAHFGFDGDLLAAVEIGFVAPEAAGGLLETAVNLGVEAG